MRVLVVGASGLIGTAVCARLIEAGHQVHGVVRRQGRAPPGLDQVIRLDIASVGHAGQWERHLRGVDAVVNCAGVFQDSVRESTEGVHVRGADMLFEACERLGPRKVIQFSAIGVDRGARSEFSRSKFEGDKALMARELDYVILRPSMALVV